MNDVQNKLNNEKLLYLKTLEENQINRNYGIWNFPSTSQDIFLPDYGWKIHLSGTIKNANYVLKRFLEFKNKYGEFEFKYKVIKSIDNLNAMNSGIYGYSQIGKMITVYPKQNQFHQVCKRLHTFFKGTVSVNVPSDYQYKYGSNVFYRYGTIKNDKFKIDKRDKKLKPSKILEPDYSRKRLNKFPKNIVIISLLARKGDEQTYSGIDLNTRKQIIIRIASTLSNLDITGEDSIDRLENEYEFLSEHKEEGFEKVVDSFYVDKNFVLVTEKEKGITLYDALKKYNISNKDKLAIFCRVINLILLVHKYNYVYRDLSLKNILLQNDNVKLIDFEFIQPNNSTNVQVAGTDGFFDQNYFKIDYHCDYYGLSKLVYFMFNFKEYQDLEKQDDIIGRRKNLFSDDLPLYKLQKGLENSFEEKEVEKILCKIETYLKQKN